MIHALKIEAKHFNDVVDGRKTFEVRKHDRDYRVGDYLALNELDDTTTTYTGRSVIAYVRYLLADEKYCKDGYVIMSIELCPIIRPKDISAEDLILSGSPSSFNL